jgi:ABC-type nitrate/sulfonate/bicarbonate transport system substrate-binding protein
MPYDARRFLRSGRWLILLSAAMLLVAGVAQAEPAKIRVAIGGAAEDQFWLQLARPDLAPHAGKSYVTEYTRFAGAAPRFQAFEAGAIDIATSSANGALFAAGEGVEFKMIASLTREGERGFYTRFMVLNNSPLKSVKDLKGKTIGINAFSGSGHLWTRTALEVNGLAESDVTIVPLPFPAQGEAVKSRKVDVGMFPQPFYTMVEKEGLMRELYSSKTGVPFEEELILLIAKQEFLTKNAAAVRDLLADLVVVNKYYSEHNKEAKRALIDAKMVRLDPETYFAMKEYYRDPGARIDAQALDKMQQMQIKAGFQKNQADLSKYIDMSYLPK